MVSDDLCQKPVVDIPDILPHAQTSRCSYGKYSEETYNLNHLLWASTSLAREWGSSYNVYEYIVITLQHIVISFWRLYLLHILAQSSNTILSRLDLFTLHTHLQHVRAILRKEVSSCSLKATPTGGEYTASDWNEDAAWPARLARTAQGPFPHLTASTPGVQGHIINHRSYLCGFLSSIPKHVKGVHVWFCTHGSQTCSESSFFHSPLRGQAWP